jgi:prepilin-type N-terminal cleavage/methylation domain-containing protein
LRKINKNDHGFTIVELVIVIAVIAGLIFLVITTYSSIQAKARNNTRTLDINKIQARIEIYFTQNSHYPSLNDMNSTTWLDKNMPTLNSSVLVDPSSKTKSTKLGSGTPAIGEYVYNPTQADGITSCESDDTTCAKYTLGAKYEGTVNGSKSVTLQNLD